MTIRPCLYAAAMLILVACPAAAELYHWVDDSGVNHFANEPPPAGVKAENSWAEVKYDAAADKAQAAENQRVINQGEARDAAAADMAEKAAAADERTLKAKIKALESRQAELANALLSVRYNFREQANAMRRRLKDLDREIVAAETAGADATALKNERLEIWNKLFTTRYVVRNGYSIMEQYRKVTQQIDDLKR